MRWLLWTSVALLAGFTVFTTTLSFTDIGREQLKDWMQLVKFSRLGFTPAGVEASAVKEQRVLSSLVNRQRSLDERDRLLTRQEGELRNLQQNIQKELADLAKTQQKLQESLQALEAEQGNVKRVVALFNGMSPKQASERLQSLKQDIAVQILVKMKADKAAKILGELPPDYVKQITEEIVNTAPTRSWKDSLRGL